MAERRYLFHKNFGDNRTVSTEVNESDLTEAQKNLLVAELIKKFGSMPFDVQDKFVDYLVTESKKFQEKNG